MTESSALLDLLMTGRPTAHHHPCARFEVTPETWTGLSGGLARLHFTLFGLWGDDNHVHMALRDNHDNTLAVASVNCSSGSYPSVSALHRPALRLERTLADLFGIVPEGLPDTRPWLDYGRWSQHHPLRNAAAPGEFPAQNYQFLASESEDEALHQIPVGPVHAGIIEPGHFRFTANGETVVRLEARLGYVHKGIEKLMQGVPVEQAAKLAGRVSGDSTVAYALAFARAFEAAIDLPVPPRAHWLRALMAELERLANHFGDIGAICNDAAFALMNAHCGILREQTLLAVERCFGHRLSMDRIIPGGVANDLETVGITTLRDLIAQIRQLFPELIELYDNTASLQDRTVNTGIVTSALVQQYGAGGFIGRASGRDFDVRRDLVYPPYDELNFTVPVLHEGDVNARVWIRIHEVEQSLNLLEQLLNGLPGGPVHTPYPVSTGEREGLALVEGFRGDILLWLRLNADGSVARCHPRDPSWFQWPLLEAAIEGNIVADFPLCNKSFNCSYSGVDL